MELLRQQAHAIKKSLTVLQGESPCLIDVQLRSCMSSANFLSILRRA